MNITLSNFSRFTLIGQGAGVVPSNHGGMRDLMREAALLVAMQTTRGQTENYQSLRDRCRLLVTQFGAALDERRYARDVRQDAMDALCALIDESSLHHLSDTDKQTWAGQPLQVELFQKHAGGELIFERLEARMREASPNVDLLECYATVLGLGFKGKFAVAAASERQALLMQLNALIEGLRPRVARPFLIESGARRFTDRLRNFSPWALAGVACCIALVVWVAWHVALDAQIASLKSQATTQPAKP